MVCFDTSFIVDLRRDDPSALRKLREFAKSGENLSTTVINIGELYKGAYGHHNCEERLKEVDELIHIFLIFEMNIIAAKNYGYYHQYLKEKGKMLDDRDILIASIAFSFEETKIVTRNIEHFRRIPGIDVITY